MRMTYLAPSFPPQLGGMGTACYYTANELGARHDVRVLLPQRPVAYQTGRYRLETFRPWLSYGYADAYPFIAKKLQDDDIVHLYYPYFGVAEFLPLLKTRRQRPRIILHYQMDMVGRGVTKFFGQAQRYLCQPWLFRAVDAIFVLSEDYARHSRFSRYWELYRDKIYVVPNGVDINKFVPAPIDLFLRQQLNLSADDFVVFTAQALDQQHYFKGIDILLSAVKILKERQPDIPLVVVIAGDGDLRVSYQNLANLYKITEQIKFVGRVGHDDLPRYYQLSDLVVVPSTANTESFSITAAEAMACAKPVLVSDWPGLRGTIEDGLSGFVLASGQAEIWAQKIGDCYQQQPLLVKMGLAARAKAESQYDWANIGRQVEKIYRDITKRSR